jgi:polysaccharide biosynthesis protein PslH
MKILYLMSEIPYPPRGGGALRIMGLLKGAAEAGHEIHVIAFGENQPSAKNEFTRLCTSLEVVPMPERSKLARVKTLLFSRQADMEQRNWSEAFWQAVWVRLVREKFDIVQFQSLEMGVYLPHVHDLNTSAKLIYDAYNAEAELQRMVFQTERGNPSRWVGAVYSWIQWQRLRRFERGLCRTADAVIAVSEADQELLQKIAGSTPVHLVNNGITVADYETPPKDILSLKQPSLIFTGIMDYRPNVDAAVWFADEIFPQIEDAELYLVGNRPHPRVQALSERPNIYVTGFVEDVTPYLYEGTLFIVPLRMGSGTRLKLLQAMAARCAIVSTSVGAMGISVQNGRDMLLADNPVNFAAAVTSLLNDAQKQYQMGEAAHSFVQEHFDWSVIVPRLIAVYEATAQ